MIKKVLLVEDEPVHAMLFEEFFKEINPKATIVTCKRFMAFRGIVATETFDLFVMDYNLDCYTAIEYIKVIRRIVDHDDTPIIVMSASFEGDERMKLENIGVKTMQKTGDKDAFIKWMKENLSSNGLVACHHQPPYLLSLFLHSYLCAQSLSA